MNIFIRFAICSVMLITCRCSDISGISDYSKSPNTPNKALAALGSNVNAHVVALCSDALGNIYAGGQFTTAGGASVNYIAKWNGSTWTALGSGMNGYIYALCCDPDGNIYAGGQFTTAGGVPANYIAKWNGSNWTALGSNGKNGMNGSVYSLCSDAYGNIYAGGYFTAAGDTSAKCIAIWDGRIWMELGSGMDYNVIALCSDPSGKNIYAGGYFTTAGGVSVNHIAKWDVDENTWSALDSGEIYNEYDYVAALCSDADGNIYAGGKFTTVNGVSANRIAKWDVKENTWTALGSGMNERVLALCSDSSGNIYAGGHFTTAGGASVNYISKWNGSTWTALGSGTNAYVITLCRDADGNIYAGGAFTIVGGTSANFIAKWNVGASTWTALGLSENNGVNSSVLALCSDSSGNIYAGGVFTTAGGISANRIAKWDVKKNTWTALGSGMNSYVYALCSDPFGNIYAGGVFTTAEGISANRIAKWDVKKNTWTALGSGMNGHVYALYSDADGNIYAGGAFTTAGGTSANFVAKWNVRTSTWIALGSDVNNGMNDFVNTLCSDSSGNIYAGGAFTTAGGAPANYIAKWNVSSSTWTALGSDVNNGINDYVYALCSDSSGNIYAGGVFTTAGVTSANNIAKWNVSTSTWSALGSSENNGMNSSVYALCSDSSGNIYAGGYFTIAGGTSANKIAKWNVSTSTWTALGSGVNDSVYAFCSDSSGNIYAGGDFTTAGGTPANYIAVWK